MLSRLFFFDMYLQAWNTQQAIADIMGEPRKTIADIINNGEKARSGDFAKTFEPIIYNIWNLHKAEKETAHFGHFPQVFAEIKIRAEKRMGEMLIETEKHPPGPDKKDRSHDVTDPPKLKDIGITKKQSSRWQATAQIPDEDFENHITETKQGGKELTSAGVLKMAKNLLL